LTSLSCVSRCALSQSVIVYLSGKSLGLVMD
jgi:hypothetical protein